MAKKGLIVVVLAAFGAAGVFAQGLSLSAGVGGLIGGDFGGGVEGSAGGQSVKYETPYFGGGAFAFFDATYAELSLAFLGGGGKFKFTSPGGDTDQDFSIANFNIGLLGKYPFAINDKLALFPLLGIEYQIALDEKMDGEKYEGFDGDGKPGDFSALWFKFGGGLDFAVTEKIYLRFEALYGIRLENQAEKDLEDYFKAMVPGIDTKALLGHGLIAKLAAGYKF